MAARSAHRRNARRGQGGAARVPRPARRGLRPPLSPREPLEAEPWSGVECRPVGCPRRAAATRRVRRRRCRSWAPLSWRWACRRSRLCCSRICLRCTCSTLHRSASPTSCRPSRSTASWSWPTTRRRRTGAWIDEGGALHPQIFRVAKVPTRVLERRSESKDIVRWRLFVQVCCDCRSSDDACECAVDYVRGHLTVLPVAALLPIMDFRYFKMILLIFRNDTRLKYFNAK